VTGPVRITVQGARALAIAADHWPAANRPPVVLLHGGGQTRHAWGETGRALAARGYEVIAMDLRGHGDSGWAADRDYSLDAYRDDLQAVQTYLGRPAVLMGASLGGIAAMLAAGEGDPALVSALVLVDITHRPSPEGASKIQAFMRSGRDGFVSLDEAVDAVAAYLPHRRRPRDPSGLMKNLRQRNGRLHWHWDPQFLDHAASDRGRVDGRLDRAATAVGAPTLLVRGALSDIVTPDDVEAFRQVVPHAEFAEVAGAAHMVAGDENTAFGDAVLDFLTRVAPPEKEWKS
jgi:pimeloyl-ACP methyl ester carboxylesterase